MPAAAAPAVEGRRVEVEAVGRTFASDQGAVQALSRVDLTIEQGEFVSILGPSGCGKSTLMSLIAGLDEPSEGRVLVGGELVDGPVTDAGVMFQRDLLLEWRTCERNVLLQFELRGQPAAPHRPEARRLLELAGVGHAAQRYPHELSGGMRQRVALCRALVHQPPLLLMDEPFGALDALTRESLHLELARMTARSGATVVLVTHGIDEAVFLSDRVLVMSPRPGRIIADVRVELPRPRVPAHREAPAFAELAGYLRRLLAEPGAPERARHG